MSFRALVQVGGYDFPEPSSYTSKTATIVDSGRNTDGVVIGSVIRDNVASVEIGWRYLTAAQWARVLQCFTIAQGGAFSNTVTFYDQAVAGWVTKTMYVSDRDSGMWRRDPSSGEILGWTDCKLSLVEV